MSYREMKDLKNIWNCLTAEEILRKESNGSLPNGVIE
jgi:hypothetical protein